MWPFKKRTEQSEPAPARNADSEIARFLESWRSRRLKAEDGGLLELTLPSPTDEQSLGEWEQSRAVSMPRELRDMLAYANPPGLFGLELLALDSIDEYGDLIPFHDWGNGDFDCIGRDGAVVFTNHSPDVQVEIAPTLLEWLQRVVGEIEQTGALRHPGDYRDRPEPGVYAHVLTALEGVDCELNR
ncbi:MAG: SMI1/KNR4 family protein [Phycisphaerales bacterium JB039]